MNIRIIILIFLAVLSSSYGQEKLLFFQTDWGNHLSWNAFCERAKESGYDGIEIWMPSEAKNRVQLKAALAQHGLLVGFLNGTDKSLPFEESLEQYTNHLKFLITWRPAYINCHTGNDFFTIDQNKAFIDAANQIGEEHDIPVYHETHRGRFSYNLPDTKTYLELIPKLKLTLDISHWMVVHESLLQQQDRDLEGILNRSYHIHARVGHAEGPQVNDPEAPEWDSTLDRHLSIWEKVIRKKWKENAGVFTITTEFGPPNYLPTLPYTKIPVADQWKANIFIMSAIKKRMNVE